MIFEYFFSNLAFQFPWQPIKFSSLDKIHMLHSGLLKEHFCTNFCQNICSEIVINANFHFSHYKSMVTVSCHSNQIGTSNILIHSSLPIDALCETWKASASWLQRRCHSKKLTGNRWKTDAYLYYKLTNEPSTQVR